MPPTIVPSIRRLLRLFKQYYNGEASLDELIDYTKASEDKVVQIADQLELMRNEGELSTWINSDVFPGDTF